MNLPLKQFRGIPRPTEVSNPSTPRYSAAGTAQPRCRSCVGSSSSRLRRIGALSPVACLENGPSRLSITSTVRLTDLCCLLGNQRRPHATKPAALWVLVQPKPTREAVPALSGPMSPSASRDDRITEHFTPNKVTDHLQNAVDRYLRPC